MVQAYVYVLAAVGNDDNGFHWRQRDNDAVGRTLKSPSATSLSERTRTVSKLTYHTTVMFRSLFMTMLSSHAYNFSKLDDLCRRVLQRKNCLKGMKATATNVITRNLQPDKIIS